MYNYGRQSIDEEDVQAVVDVLRGDWLTQGPMIPAFEKALGSLLGAPHCTVTSNGTASLHLIALGLGWRKTDIVITSPITFVASANCIVYAGATPDFADIDERSYTIDPEKVEERILFHKRNGRTVRAVIGVDYAGHPCDWEALAALAGKYDLQLVNDHCHAIGSSYGGDPHFAARYADAVNISFHPVKHITTGEGGAIVTRHEWLDEKVKLLRNHGLTKDPAQMGSHDGPWYYEMIDLGYNYRITDFQCALGIRQLAKLDRFVERRKMIAAEYDRAFAGDFRVRIPEVKEGCLHSYHLYPARVQFKKLGLTRSQLFEALKSRGIVGQVHYIPIHLQPYYRKLLGTKAGDYPVGEQFYEEEISLPCYPTLESAEVGFIVNSIREVLVTA